jgi:DNA-binding CsgD family transcriptional regulator
MEYGGTAACGLERAVDLLYEAVTDSARWEPFLKTCAETFDATAAALSIFESSWNGSVFSVRHNMDHVVYGKYVEHIHADPRLPMLEAKPGMAVSDHLELPQSAFDASPLYTEVMRPAGIEYGMGVHLPMEGLNAGFVICRPPAARVFDEAEVARFGVLVPHLRRAVRLVVQFLKLEREKWAALSVLDQMPLGLAVADAESHLLHANAAAGEILERRDGLLARHGQLWGGTPELSNRLRGAIRAAVEGAAPHQAMTLPRREGAPLLLRIGALHRNTLAGQPFVLTQPVAVLYLTDPDRPQETMPELLQRLYGLTEREVELAARLAQGARLDDCAAAMDISMPTARTHLRTIFAKTGAATQADLVRLVLAAPVWTPPAARNGGRACTPAVPG